MCVCVGQAARAAKECGRRREKNMWSEMVCNDQQQHKKTPTNHQEMSEKERARPRELCYNFIEKFSSSLDVELILSWTQRFVFMCVDVSVCMSVAVARMLFWICARARIKRLIIHFSDFFFLPSPSSLLIRHCQETATSIDTMKS